jgi:hypothetical protein
MTNNLQLLITKLFIFSIISTYFSSGEDQPQDCKSELKNDEIFFSQLLVLLTRVIQIMCQSFNSIVQMLNRKNYSQQ